MHRARAVEEQNALAKAASKVEAFLLAIGP